VCIAGSYPNTLSDVNYYVGIGGSYPNTLSDVNYYVLSSFRDRRP